MKQRIQDMITDKPEWLTQPAPDAEVLEHMKRLLDQECLHTVCESADCPNIGMCFAEKTCTFMILGNVCTRNCRFCAVSHGSPESIDDGEPYALAAMAGRLGLKHIVITSVTRDDLRDGGAAHFAATVRAVRTELPKATIEVLIPDFKGSMEALQTVLHAKPDVINHNIETVPRLYSDVRPQAEYQRSLALIDRVYRSDLGIVTKSGLMLGLGEKNAEVIQVVEELYTAGCQMLTLGQYLSPSPQHLPVVEYIHPDTFTTLKQKALEIGFAHVSAGPLVRSSYHAGIIFTDLMNCREQKTI